MYIRWLSYRADRRTFAHLDREEQPSGLGRCGPTAALDRVAAAAANLAGLFGVVAPDRGAGRRKLLQLTVAIHAGLEWT